jgi:hypothetical protein
VVRLVTDNPAAEAAKVRVYASQVGAAISRPLSVTADPMHGLIISLRGQLKPERGPLSGTHPAVLEAARLPVGGQVELPPELLEGLTKEGLIKRLQHFAETTKRDLGTKPRYHVFLSPVHPAGLRVRRYADWRPNEPSYAAPRLADGRTWWQVPGFLNKFGDYETEDDIEL